MAQKTFGAVTITWMQLDKIKQQQNLFEENNEADQKNMKKLIGLLTDENTEKKAVSHKWQPVTVIQRQNFRELMTYKAYHKSLLEAVQPPVKPIV